MSYDEGHNYSIFEIIRKTAVPKTESSHSAAKLCAGERAEKMKMGKTCIQAGQKVT